MSVQAILTSNLTVQETIIGADSNAQTIQFSGLNENGVAYNAGTAVPVSKQSNFSQALTSGAATVNLAALPGLTSDETVVGTGLRIQLMKISAPATNANPITIAKGASNGHTGLGSSWSQTVKPGQTALFQLDSGGTVIASGDRTFDLAGTAVQVLNFSIVLG